MYTFHLKSKCIETDSEQILLNRVIFCSAKGGREVKGGATVTYGIPPRGGLMMRLDENPGRRHSWRGEGGRGKERGGRGKGEGGREREEGRGRRENHPMMYTTQGTASQSRVLEFGYGDLRLGYSGVL